MRQQTIFSPLVVFLCLLGVFELTLRLPFVLYALNTPATGQALRIQFFSLQAPADVITIGLTIAGMAIVAGLFASAISGARFRSGWAPGSMQEIPLAIYPVGLLFIGASIGAIASLGPAALAEDISSKREVTFGLTYVLLKMSNFSHLIAALLFVRMHQTGWMMDRIAFGLAVLTLIGTSIVFSQRAILISLLLEIVYLQLILGTFRVRRVAWLGLAVVAAGLTISALRPQAASMSFFEAMLFGAEKLVQSRYFLDFTKLGTVTLWANGEPWLGPVLIGFIFEPFLGDQVLFYKEVGPMLASEVYLYRSETGVTPGALLEGVLSFGIVGGVICFGLLFFGFLRAERWLLAGGPHDLWTAMLLLLILSKFSLLINSSLGAFAFQFMIEFAMLVFAFGLLSVLGALRTGPGRRRAARRPGMLPPTPLPAHPPAPYTPGPYPGAIPPATGS